MLLYISRAMSTVFETQLTWLASQEERELSDDDDGLVLAGWVAVVASWERVDAARKVAKAAHTRAAHARAKYWAVGVFVVARRAANLENLANVGVVMRVAGAAAIIRMAQSWAARRIQAVARGRALRARKVRFADIGCHCLIVSCCCSGNLNFMIPLDFKAPPPMPMFGASAPAPIPSPYAAAVDDFGDFGGFGGAPAHWPIPSPYAAAVDDFGDFGGFGAPAPAPPSMPPILIWPAMLVDDCLSKPSKTSCPALGDGRRRLFLCN